MQKERLVGCRSARHVPGCKRVLSKSWMMAPNTLRRTALDSGLLFCPQTFTFKLRQGKLSCIVHNIKMCDFWYDFLTILSPPYRCCNLRPPGHSLPNAVCPPPRLYPVPHLRIVSLVTQFPPFHEVEILFLRPNALAHHPRDVRKRGDSFFSYSTCNLLKTIDK